MKKQGGKSTIPEAIAMCIYTALAITTSFGSVVVLLELAKEAGREEVRKEAFNKGFGTYDVNIEEGTWRFRWLGEHETED